MYFDYHQAELDVAKVGDAATSPDPLVRSVASQERPVRFAILGAAGPHARKTWAPALQKLAAVGRAEVVLAVELTGHDAGVAGLYGDDVDLLLTGPFVNQVMSEAFKARLGRAIRRLAVDAVIVATEPLAHLTYLEALVPTGVHLLVDKPIVAFEQVSNDPAQAARVLSEYERLVDLHRANPKQVIAVAVQRGHHVGFAQVRELVAEAAAQFGCPVRSIRGRRVREDRRGQLDVDWVGRPTLWRRPRSDRALRAPGVPLISFRPLRPLRPLPSGRLF